MAADTPAAVPLTATMAASSALLAGATARFMMDITTTWESQSTPSVMTAADGATTLASDAADGATTPATIATARAITSQEKNNHMRRFFALFVKQ